MHPAREVVRVITRLANPVAVAFSLTACFVPGVQTSREAPTTVDAPAQADPVDPASLTCEVLTDRSGGCDVNRDCETQCDSGDARACEVMGRALLMDQGAAAEWANRCRGGARSAWCGTPAPEDAAQRFLVRACDLGSGVGCFGLSSLYIAHPEKQRAHGELGDVTARSKALLAKACECGAKDGCSALAKMYVVGARMMLNEQPPDEANAAALLSEACKLGDTNACHAGLRIVASGSGQFDPRLASDLSANACKHGDQDACAVSVCGRAARLTLERQGKVVSPEALAQPMVACTVAMKNSDPETARGVAGCFDSNQSLDCLEPIGGLRVVQADEPVGQPEQHEQECVGGDDASCLRLCRSGNRQACKEACSADSKPCNALCRTGNEPACDGADNDVVSGALSRSAERNLPTLFAQCRANRAAMERWRVAYVAAQRSGNSSEMQRAGAEMEKLGPRWSTTLSDLRQAIQVVTNDEGPRFQELIRRVDRECNCKSSPSGHCR